MYCRYQHAKILTQWREMRGCIIYQISDLNKYWIGNLETVRNAVSNYKKWLLSHLCCGGKQFIQVSIDCVLAVVRVRLPTAAPPSSAFYTRDFTDGARAAADAPSCFLHQYMRFFTNTYSFHTCMKLRIEVLHLQQIFCDEILSCRVRNLNFT